LYVTRTHKPWLYELKQLVSNDYTEFDFNMYLVPLERTNTFASQTNKARARAFYYSPRVPTGPKLMYISLNLAH
jgi:hypothetical protein